jgi:hypothetical protein
VQNRKKKKLNFIFYIFNDKMKKGFGTPTISSVNKNSQEPASLRDKILKLSSAVKELKSNAI